MKIAFRFLKMGKSSRLQKSMLYVCMIILYLCLMCVLCSVAQFCPTLFEPMDCSLPGSSVHGDSPGKKTRVGFAMPSSRGSSQPMDRTQVSSIAGGFFTIWSTREALPRPHPLTVGPSQSIKLLSTQLYKHRVKYNQVGENYRNIRSSDTRLSSLKILKLPSLAISNFLM